MVAEKCIGVSAWTGPSIGQALGGLYTYSCISYGAGLGITLGRDFLGRRMLGHRGHETEAILSVRKTSTASYIFLIMCHSPNVAPYAWRGKES